MLKVNANVLIVEYPGYGVYSHFENKNWMDEMIEEDALNIYNHVSN